MGIPAVRAGFGEMEGPGDVKMRDMYHVIWEVMIGDVTERGDFLFGPGCALMTDDSKRKRLHRGGVGADGEGISGGVIRGRVGVDLNPKLDRWVVVVGDVQVESVGRGGQWRGTEERSE